MTKPDRDSLDGLSIEEIGHRVLEERWALEVYMYTDKPIGLFRMSEAVAGFEHFDAAAGFHLRIGDPYLELHIPPDSPEDFRSLAGAQESFNRIARYIDMHRLDSRYVLGITYPALGRVAARCFGFGISQLQLAENPLLARFINLDEMEFLYETSTNAGKRGREMGEPVIAFQDRESFLMRYLT